MIKAFSFDDRIIKEINKTFINLIPKSNKLESSHYCRPISSCKASYKIIAKSLAKRTKPLLNKIASFCPMNAH